MTASIAAATAPAVQVHPADDVVVALRDLVVGEPITAGGTSVRLIEDAPTGHKVALRDIPLGADVRKFGWPIGRASAPIARGALVHANNLATSLDGVGHHASKPHAAPAPGCARTDATFLGYPRADGRVGTRNEIWVIATVGCVANTCARIAARANARRWGAIDGVHAITHPFGCSQLGDDLDRTRALLAALANHPNAGGVLIVGLGCESNQLKDLLAAAGHLPAERVHAFAAQSVDDEIEAGLAALEDLAAVVAQDQRAPCAAGELVVGLKCGGSDGLSGLSANPLVGRIADRVTDEGGTAILTEIPEIFGAEHVLLARAADDATRAAATQVIDDFKRNFIAHDQPIHENPSPGNIAGGITTLEEKSLGAVQKAGGAQLTDVLRYGERARRPGLALLEAPGNDAVSSTALAAAGATVLLFTTGRGTPLGFPAPTLKIASNAALAARKPHWIDFDTSGVLAGEPSDDAAERLFQLVLATASGQRTRAEENGEREIAIWKDGVTL